MSSLITSTTVKQETTLNYRIDGFIHPEHEILYAHLTEVDGPLEDYRLEWEAIRIPSARIAFNRRKQYLFELAQGMFLETLK